MLSELTMTEISNAQQVLAKSVSTGQERMLALHSKYRGGGSAADLEIYPNLWAGVGLVRGGAGTALVGSHAEVADRIEEYASLGIEEFIFSGYPHLEEAYWFGEGVLPELQRRGHLAVQVPDDLSGLFRQTIARAVLGRRRGGNATPAPARTVGLGAGVEHRAREAP